MSGFDAAFTMVVEAEGGYSDDPDDPGGKTMFGVTEAVARANGYVGAMRDLPKAKAMEIYRRDYWDACRCEELPWPVSYFVFDAAVNQGPDVAKRLLQKAIGVAQDGVVGNNTMAAIKRADKSELCALFMADRALRYTGTRNFDKYGRGWLKRLFKVAFSGGLEHNV